MWNMTARSFSSFWSEPAPHLRYECVPSLGPARKEMIVIHGLLGNRAYFRKICNTPAIREETTSYLINLRNHGDSPRTDSMTMNDMCDDIVHFANRKELKKPILFGHSMGGLVAMHTALRNPERFSAVIIEDIAPINYLALTPDEASPVVELYEQLKACSKLNLKREEREIVDDLHKILQDPIRTDFIRKNLKVDRIRGQYQWSVNLDVILRDFKDYVGDEFEGTFEGPVHLIAGGLSRYMNPMLVAEYLKYFPNFDVNMNVRMIDDAGHWVHFDKPREFIQNLKEVLTGLPDIEARKLPPIYSKYLHLSLFSGSAGNDFPARALDDNMLSHQF